LTTVRHLVAGVAEVTSDAAIGVHFAVGYTNVVHLLPAFSGLALFSLGLGLSYSFLCNGGQEAKRDP
jgi:hypothetical protein